MSGGVAIVALRSIVCMRRYCCCCIADGSDARVLSNMFEQAYYVPGTLFFHGFGVPSSISSPRAKYITTCTAVLRPAGGVRCVCSFVSWYCCMYTWYILLLRIPSGVFTYEAAIFFTSTGKCNQREPSLACERHNSGSVLFMTLCTCTAVDYSPKGMLVRYVPNEVTISPRRREKELLTSLVPQSRFGDKPF